MDRAGEERKILPSATSTSPSMFYGIPAGRWQYILATHARKQGLARAATLQQSSKFRYNPTWQELKGGKDLSRAAFKFMHPWTSYSQGHCSDEAYNDSREIA